MKLNLLTTSLLGIAVVAANLSVGQVYANDSEVKFICADSFDSESNASLPTTFAWTNRGKIAVVRWQTENFADAGFSSQQRCEAVSPRFQEAYNNNSIGLITNGTMDNQPVICTSDAPGGDCNTLLMTLRPEDDSLKVLNNLKQVLNGEQVGPVPHSADSQVYYQVDIENFLETAPVE
jgi:hypothetical protein